MPSVVGERPARSVDDALELLFQASRTRAKQRQVKTSEVIDIICTHAFENGLDDEALRDVVHIASKKTELDQTSVTTLVKNLYPARRVSADVVVTVVGSLGQGKGKPSPSTQNGLVKWLAIVHEIIVDPSVLSCLYGVLFGMLDMISIRTSLCHLLSLITRRKHVKPFRIQQLLGLSRSIGNEPALQGLLRLYKDYYPDIILGSASTSRKSFAPRPDPEWQSRILAIQEASSSTNDPTLDHLNGFKVFRKGPKRIKTSAIPDVHTYHAQETSVTLEGIDNAEDFVERLDRIEPPGQLISYLTDPLLQKYIELKPSEITSRRIHLWLATCLDEQYEAARSGTPDEQYLSEILAGLLRHTQYTKALLPITSTFLAEYLPIWNGLSNVDTILGLLSYIPIQPFDDAYPTYFEPTEKALTAQNQNAYENLLHFYRDLLTNWIAAATPSPHRLRPATASHHPHMLHGLVTHVSTLSISLALSLPQDTDTRLTSAILSFYELLCSSSIPNRIPILIPPMHLVYLLIQTPSPSTLTRTISAIASCKSAFDAHPKPIKDYYPSYVTDPLNSCLRDIYNLLWVSRGLVVAENKAAGLLCKPSLREALNVYLASLDHEYAIGTAFGLSHNAWLASLSAAAWRTLEEAEVDMQGYDRHSQNLNWHKGPVSQRSLEVLAKSGGVQMEWERYKIHVLHWLEARGMPGIKELMFATVTDLKSRYNTR